MTFARWLGLLVTMLAGCLTGWPLAAMAADDIHIGILAPIGRETAQTSWSELERWLGKALPDARLRFSYLTPDELTAAVDQHRLQFILTNPGHYITLETRHGASRIATLESGVSPVADKVIGSALIVPAGSPVRKLADLRYRRVGATAPDAFGGYQIAVRELLAQGLDPKSDFAALRFTGFPVQKLFEVLDAGEADAIIVGSCQMETLLAQGRIRAGAYRVLPPPVPPPAGYRCQVSSRLYPDWPFATLAGTPHELAKRVAVILLTMPHGPGDAGFTVPTDYAEVRALFRELHLGPYAYLAEWSWQDVVRRHWEWLLAGLVLLALWVLHTIRAELLVEQRTRQLRQAMSAREQAEAESRRQREQLDHLSRLGLLGEISSQLAHEINQPLAAIGNYARGLVRRVENGRLETGALVEAGHEISAQADRAAAIVQRVRAFARKRVSERQPVEVAALLADAIRLFGVAWPAAANIRVDNQLPADVLVNVDSLQIQQVLFNLLKNACDANAAVSPAVREVEVGVQPRDAATLRITVADHGPALPEDTLARMGEPFFTSKTDGLGIGLSISQSIIEAHGGHLRWQPRPDGAGLVVSFTLPLFP